MVNTDETPGAPGTVSGTLRPIEADETRELAERFNRLFEACDGRPHPNIGLGVGYRAFVEATESEAAPVGEKFYDLVQDGRRSELPHALRPPCTGPDVLCLEVEPLRVICNAQGEKHIRPLIIQSLLAGVFRSAAQGVCFERDGASLVVALALSAGDLRALHLHLDARNAAFGF